MGLCYYIKQKGGESKMKKSVKNLTIHNEAPSVLYKAALKKERKEYRWKLFDSYFTFGSRGKTKRKLAKDALLSIKEQSELVEQMDFIEASYNASPTEENASVIANFMTYYDHLNNKRENNYQRGIDELEQDGTVIEDSVYKKYLNSKKRNYTIIKVRSYFHLDQQYGKNKRKIASNALESLKKSYELEKELSIVGRICEKQKTIYDPYLAKKTIEFTNVTHDHEEEYQKQLKALESTRKRR